MSRAENISKLRPAGAAHRLHAIVIDRHDKSFAWGIRDCCLWAADAVYASTGRDPMSGVRGSYWSALQAARVVRENGGLDAMVTARMGAPISVADAIDGDVCMLAPEAQEYIPGLGALGVLWRGSILAQAEKGLCVHRLHLGTTWWGANP